MEKRTNVKTIEDFAFYNCTNLKEITIDNTEEFVKQNWHEDWKNNCSAK